MHMSLDAGQLIRIIKMLQIIKYEASVQCNS